jgi:riboflavin biosynthesis pyrimidine reductase
VRNRAFTRRRHDAVPSPRGKLAVVRRLFPEPAAEVSPDDLYGFARTPLEDRPWVGVCMVASLDGSTVVDGRSKGLSNSTDSAVLACLRRAADVILVGAATVRQEQYGPPRTTGQRLGVVTTRGDVDTGSELFTTGAGFLVMPEDGPPAPRSATGAPIDVVRAGRGRVDPAGALRRLGDVIGRARFVHVEGGPHLNASLLDADCVDELDLTVSPLLVGGDGARVVAGGAPTALGFELAHLAIDEESFAFTRWVRRRPA